jgi:hypothetical protein
MLVTILTIPMPQLQSFADVHGVHRAARTDRRRRGAHVQRAARLVVILGITALCDDRATR